MRLSFRRGETTHEVEVAAQGEGRFRVEVDGVRLEVTAVARGESLELRGAHGLVRAWVTADGPRRWVSAPGVGEALLERVEPRARGRGAETGGDLASPMPGRVVKVLVCAGDEVARGATLVVVEAMKTELAIAAPRDGRVARVLARAGDMCEAGRPLVELAPPG